MLEDSRTWRIAWAIQQVIYNYYTCEFVCVVYIHICVSVHGVCAHRGQRSMLSVFLYHSPPSFFTKKDLYLNLEIGD